MVKYLCGVCDAPYNTEKLAEKCENQEPAGPKIKPGLMLKRKDSKTHILFYKNCEPEGHEKTYLVEMLRPLEEKYVPDEGGKIDNSRLIQLTENPGLEKVEGEIIKKINEFEDPSIFIRSGSIKKYGIKEVHNECDFLN